MRKFKLFDLVMVKVQDQEFGARIIEIFADGACVVEYLQNVPTQDRVGYFNRPNIRLMTAKDKKSFKN